MKERPILFSAPMVRAILDGKKTQTRRIFKDTAEDYADDAHPLVRWKDCKLHRAECRYGNPGDNLWVRETIAKTEDNGIFYRADGLSEADMVANEIYKWTPAIHMPRIASRIDLEITAVRAERLQGISEQDATAEGYASDGDESARIWYSSLWDKINGTGAWDKNPWVWVIEFRRIKP